MTKIVYQTSGTCAREIHIEVEGGIVAKVIFVGGCAGNAQGISALVKGREITEVIGLLKGIQCRNNTSCPDQLAVALASLALKKAS